MEQIDCRTLARQNRTIGNTQKYRRTSIKKSVMKSTLAKYNKNMTEGQDGHVIEVLEALDNFGIDNITDTINEV